MLHTDIAPNSSSIVGRIWISVNETQRKILIIVCRIGFDHKSISILRNISDIIRSSAIRSDLGALISNFMPVQIDICLGHDAIGLEEEVTARIDVQVKLRTVQPWTVEW